MAVSFTTPRLVLLAAGLAVQLGCSGIGSADMSNDVDTDTDASTETDAVWETGVLDPSLPGLWAVSGTLRVEAGAVPVPGSTPEGSDDSDTGADPDAADSGAPTDTAVDTGLHPADTAVPKVEPQSLTVSVLRDKVVCEASAEVVAAAPLKQPDLVDKGLVAGWTLSLMPDQSEGCGWPGPTELMVGLGPSDGRLGPAADEANLSWETSYGFFLKDTKGTVLLVGLVGTEDMLAGTAPAPDKGVPPDGDYALHPLYWVPHE